MNILAVDDEYLALQSLMRILENTFSKAAIYSYDIPSDALKAVQRLLEEENQSIDLAFLDVEMPGMSGIEMAARLKQLCPKACIIFVTAYTDYAFEAYRLHASGYILKPVTKALIEEELAHIQDLLAAPFKEDKENNPNTKRVQVQTFGNFEVFVDHEPLSFSRTRSKELFAYLVDRRGSGVTLAEICSVLFEEDDGSRKYKKYAQNVIASMTTALEKAKIENVLIKKWNYLALDPEAVECDYYRFLKGDIAAINAFQGEYMSNYSWAEFTAASLNEKRDKV